MKKRVYKSWYKNLPPWRRTLLQIKRRCNCPSFAGFHRYGGRGIKCFISEEELRQIWFRDKAYLMKRPTIDRIENDGNYQLNNCQYLELEQNCKKKSYSSYCPHGHYYDPQNTKIRIRNNNGLKYRYCTECHRIRGRKYYRRKLAERELITRKEK